MNKLDLAKKWIEYHVAMKANPDISNNASFDAIMKIEDVLSDKPEEAWEIIKMIVAESKDDSYLLDNLGCGPIETLWFLHPERFKDILNREAQCSRSFAFLQNSVLRILPRELQPYLS